MVFYDFEVFACDWVMVAIVASERGEEKHIVHNDKYELESFYNKHAKDIWVGYNSNKYDQFILKAILLNINPFDVSNEIISGYRSGWQISKDFYQIPLYNFDISQNLEPLKLLEGFMGHSIVECSVPFDIDRFLTDEELKEVVDYCSNDVEELVNVFLHRKEKFYTIFNIVKTFKMPFKNISKTLAGLSAEVLHCEKPAEERFDYFDIDFCPALRLGKYEHLKQRFSDMVAYGTGKEAGFSEIVCGVEHNFGIGGVHGCVSDKYIGKGVYLLIDVTAFYPTMMIEWGYLTRNSRTPEVFKNIYNTSVEMKKAGLKKEREPYKKLSNITYGMTKDTFNKGYDPRMANNVSVNGQLLLVDLLEKIEGKCELIQSNTDGIFIKIEDSDEAFDAIDDICYEWETRTKMSLEFDVVTEVWQKDVNNYIMRKDNGKLKRKGAYVQELDDLNWELAVVNEAVVKGLTEGIHPRETILKNNNLRDFQMLCHISRKYSKIEWNGYELSERTVRVFASKRTGDGEIRKVKSNIDKDKGGERKEKFANSPDRCCILNGDVCGKSLPDWLDKEWYIRLALKHIADFGVDMEQRSLF